MQTPELLFFDEINEQSPPVGGKAQGLAELTQLGFDVPKGFVIVNAEKDNFPERLAASYEEIGAAKVAVRSSALGEDAADNSFAGQFETILNVSGLDALKQAINDCVASLDTERAAAYQADKGEEAETTMCVVVQQMVDAKAAGVLFTADPVTGRHDRLVIDAVEGLGEALVDGSTTPDHYELSENNTITAKELAGSEQVLAQPTIVALAKKAREGAAKFGQPLDMEWATDQDDNILWLQARPITTIGSDLRELDSSVGDRDVLTRCNVSEIIPGACCPLTISTQVKLGLTKMIELVLNGYSGRKPEEVPAHHECVPWSQGYIFVNLTAQLDICKYTIIGSAENAALPICGFVIPELTEPAASERNSIFRRVFAIKNLFMYLSSAKKAIADFAQAMQSFHLPYLFDAKAMHQNISDNLHWLVTAHAVHGHSSCRSGSLEAFLTNVITRGRNQPSPEEQALCAKIMSGATGVESALLVEQMDALVDLIAEHPKAKERFADVDAEKARKWLENKSNMVINRSFLAFMENHGHRGYRELELMAEAWVDDPIPLIESMQASVQARFSNLGSTKAEDHFNIATQPWLVRFFAPRVHEAIRGREQTKSLLVKMTHYFKRAYRHLADLLVKDKLLQSQEDIFFLQHEEIAELIADKSDENVAKWAEKIRLRKIAFEYQEKLSFSEVVIGKPEPQENVKIELKNGQMQGRPVSKGVVEGTARVAMTVKEAAELKPGEILIAPITDVAWTPYFSLISGLATDVGSAVSHGSVIAREYGLPCIVNLQGATSVFKTGDRVRLDAETGVLSKLEALDETNITEVAEQEAIAVPA